MTNDERVIFDGDKRVLGGKHYASNKESSVVQDLKRDKITGADGESIMSESRTGPLEFIFSTQVGSPMQTASDFTGFIHFFNTMAASQNLTPRVDFYKPSNIVIDSVQLQQKYFDTIAPTGTLNRADDITIRLNPTKTKTAGMVGDYFRFSAGTTIRSLFDPSSDEQEVEDDFSASQIAQINDGWNEIVAQQETNDTSGNKAGYLALNLVIIAYINL